MYNVDTFMQNLMIVDDRLVITPDVTIRQIADMMKEIKSFDAISYSKLRRLLLTTRCRNASQATSNTWKKVHPVDLVIWRFIKSRLIFVWGFVSRLLLNIMSLSSLQERRPGLRMWQENLISSEKNWNFSSAVK